MKQRRLVAGALTLVVLAVIGLLYLQALSQGRATRTGWIEFCLPEATPPA